MTQGQGGLPILGRGGPPDPNQPTLHTCGDCGFQLFIPGALVPVAVEYHRRGCVGPKLADLSERLTEVHRLLGATTSIDVEEIRIAVDRISRQLFAAPPEGKE